jgi:outer membrane biosynthesis protein TonB
MSAIVKPSTHHSASAFAVSLLLHGSLLLVPVLGAWHHSATRPTKELPTSVAMLGNSIEVEAPTPELAEAPATPPAPEPVPIDVSALPAEAAPEPAVKLLPADPAKSESLTAPQPRAPRKVREKPAAMPSAVAATPATGSEAPTSGAPAAGTFGQEGLAPGVRRLGYAFTRAIPAATPADAEWRELPAGRVGTIRIELTIDANNRLGAMKRWQARPGEPAPPAILQRMVERTLILLRAGQFALSGSNQPGEERLVIDVQLRDEAAEGEGESMVVQKGFVGAAPGRPGRAHFRYGSGRAFEATVTIVPAGPR